jgi:hypothetical protein
MGPPVTQKTDPFAITGRPSTNLTCAQRLPTFVPRIESHPNPCDNCGKTKTKTGGRVDASLSARPPYTR